MDGVMECSTSQQLHLMDFCSSYLIANIQWFQLKKDISLFLPISSSLVIDPHA